MTEHFNFTMPGVSINLRILKEGDLITEKKGREKQIVPVESKSNFKLDFLMICMTIN